MKTGVVGRADLLEAYLAGGPELQSAVARLLGMELVIPEPIAVPAEIRPAAAIPTPEPSPLAVAVASIPFWRAETYTRIEPPHEDGETERVEIPTPDEPTADRPPPAPLAFRPLATSAAVLTKLRRVSSFSRTSGELDVARVVDHLSRGRFPGSLPRRSRKTWGQSIHVVLDEHEHLKPYRQDQRAVFETLRRVYPRDGVEVVELRKGATQPHRRGTRRSATYQPPEPGTTVLALSDLGALALDRIEPLETWLALGKLYRKRGTRPIALVPCDVVRIPLELTRDWIVIPWESLASRTAGLSPDQVEQVSRRILTLLSYALRLEPILIREVRRLLVKGRLGAGVEARVWQDPALRGQDYEAAEFHPDKARQLQQHFESEAPDVRREVVSLLRRGHIGEYEFLWFLERLGLEAETAKLEFTDDDLGAAVRWVHEQQYVLEGDAEKRDPTSDESLWFRRAFIRLPESPLNGSAGDSLHQIWTLTCATNDHPPAGLDPARVPSLGRSLRTVEIRHARDCLVARPYEGGLGFTRPPGSLLGLIRTRSGLIKIVEPDDFWEGGVAPAWAADWGRDPFGAWAAFQVGGFTQKLRWIPRGKFLMGSPDHEEGRWDDEGPQHEVAIEGGFWMFETPCTQALWEAVMGQNPSHFRGPTRPVEQVSWDDAQAFLTRIAAMVPGLRLGLPSEEQWEYACRAGSAAARYGDLDQIAWYSENSGGETHPVALKQPNGWGLHDMLGNVWEWCADPYWEYGTGKSGASAHRVVRGGSWGLDARLVRAAYRDHDGPSLRHGYLGFRCAEFSGPGPAGSVERAASRSQRRAEPSGDDEPASVTPWLNLAGRDEDKAAFSSIVPVRVVSDIDQLSLRILTRPTWASEIGRDRHGLWAELKIDHKVSQRLRWIFPGRFRMGSPEGEAGRFEDEGPQREVRIERGFWIFATPCTQEFWEAVMGENPSHFRSPTRPVEQVSWDGCRKFVERLNGRLEGLVLSLPSEAQWEYACRAGTETATYAGDLEILSENNAPVLDGIAWYGGNCGVEFELPDGWDMSERAEKQYKFERGGTRPVGLKRPNAWGLYDMLGNVWEWCADEYREHASGKVEASAGRVRRGGSWFTEAWDVRAAFRSWSAPGSGPVNIGFRCAEFRQGVVSGARQGSEAEGAEQPGDRDPTSAAARPREDDGLSAQSN